MTLEESIYAALTSSADLVNLVGDRIYPTDQAPFDLPAPWVYYTVTDSEPENLDLKGDYTQVKNALELDILGRSYTQAKSIRSAIYNALHKYRGGQIRACFWSGEQLTQIEEGYHFSLNFSVWGTSANLVERLSSQARIVTQENLFRVFPDGQNIGLELTPNGLFLPGGKVYPTPPPLLALTAISAGTIPTRHNLKGEFRVDGQPVIGLGIWDYILGAIIDEAYRRSPWGYVRVKFWALDSPNADWGIFPMLIGSVENEFWTPEIIDEGIAGNGPIFNNNIVVGRVYGVEFI